MKTENLNKFIIPGFAVAIAFFIALFIRISVPFDSVFSGGLVKLADPDCFYQIRLLDSLLHNFPRLITFDPYTYFPYGQDVFWHPLFTYILAVPALILGGGGDDQTIYTISAYVPAVLGALAVIPVYFIGSALVNRWAGIIAALLIAIMPGEFLHRSMLGFVDHHVVESVSIATVFLFLMLAVRAANRGLTYYSVRQKDFKTFLKPVVYGILAGVFLSIYLVTWVGGLMFLLIFLVYFVIQFSIDHWRGKEVDYLAIIGGLTFLVALLLSFPTVCSGAYSSLYLVALPLSLIVVVVLAALAWFYKRRKIRPVIYPVTIIVAALAAAGLVYAIFPSFFSYAVKQFNFMFTSDVMRTITEARPLLLPNGQFSFDLAIANYSLAFFLSMIGIGFLIVDSARKKDNPELLMVAVWSLLVLLVTFGQARFTYYYAINVAIICGYLAWKVFMMFGIRENSFSRIDEISARSGHKPRKKQPRQRVPIAGFLGAVIIVLALFIYPVTGPLPKTGQWREENIPVLNTINSSVFIEDAWYHTLAWIKENTPDPFDDPGYYYKEYVSPSGDNAYPYPDSAYGIMNWWPYGHMITQISHRIPVSNPHQYGARSAAQFFTCQDIDRANAMLDKLKVKYVVIDNSMATTSFHVSITAFAGVKDEDYFEMYYKNDRGGLRGDYYFYPAYYQSFAARLYNFNGNAVIPSGTTVITYGLKVFPEGDSYKEIIDMRTFPVFEQAVDYMNKQKSPNVKIVGTNPFISPVPLEALDNYKLIHSSVETVPQSGQGEIADVKVFEYLKNQE